VFAGVTKEELVNGGLEVMLYDHHHFSGDDVIGGLRMCVPRKKEDVSPSPSPDTASPDLTRSYSPMPNINGECWLSMVSVGGCVVGRSWT
jgi:hypothetical protein